MAPKAKAPAEDVDHCAFDNVSGAYGTNTPKGTTKAPALNSSSVWSDIKRLKSRDPRSQNLLIKGYTHICTVPLAAHHETGEVQFCHEPLRLTKNGETWIQTGGQRHLEREHPTSQAAQDAQKRQKIAAEHKVQQQLSFDNPGADDGQTTLADEFKLSKEQQEL
eukprot:717399-Prymnesium_polylepis.1